MAITATFSAATGLLSVFGSGNVNNTIKISRDAAGRILVNGGAVAIVGGVATVANTLQILAFGQIASDAISLDEANGALPAVQFFGGDGNDTLTGGSGADLLFGQAGNDTLIGGTGDDQVFGQAGNDLMIWNPGDGTDLFEGGDGIDTAQVNGGNASETFTITANGTRVRFDRLSPAPFSLDIGTTENFVLNMNGGDDKFSATGNLAALINVTVDG